MGLFFGDTADAVGGSGVALMVKSGHEKRYEDMYTSHDDTGDGSIKKRARERAAHGQ
jgi:hypothetical protein